ncbi:hypothetical protein [Sphingomonas sp. IW22]|jgi:hypothetical protein|uniref:hypothetical protein n=1 Tax=Sphingomonas sp. IW22 TaxID=3242489 RepID=UPI0035229704
MLAAECWRPSLTPEAAAEPLIQKLVTNRRLAELQPATRMNTLISAMLDASGKATSAAASKPSVNLNRAGFVGGPNS